VLQSLNQHRPPGAAMQRMGAAEMRRARAGAEAEAARNGRLAQRKTGSVLSPVVLPGVVVALGDVGAPLPEFRPSFAAADVSDWCSQCERTQTTGR
jgi:hypothetical protein